VPNKYSFVYIKSLHESAEEVGIVGRPPRLARLIALAESREIELHDSVSVIDAAGSEIIEIHACAPSLQDDSGLLSGLRARYLVIYIVTVNCYVHSVIDLQL
jgi:hypothetical protein